MKYLLDTNHISPLVTPAHSLRQRFFQHLAGDDTFCIATPCITELVFGLGLLPRAKENLNEWAKLQPCFTILSFQQIEAEKAAHLQIALRRSGYQLATVDALVAVIALRDDLTLLTTDRDFAAIPNLKIENWITRPNKEN